MQRVRTYFFVYLGLLTLLFSIGVFVPSAQADNIPLAEEPAPSLDEPIREGITLILSLFHIAPRAETAHTASPALAENQSPNLFFTRIGYSLSYISCAFSGGIWRNLSCTAEEAEEPNERIVMKPRTPSVAPSSTPQEAQPEQPAQPTPVASPSSSSSSSVTNHQSLTTNHSPSPSSPSNHQSLTTNHSLTPITYHL